MYLAIAVFFFAFAGFFYVPGFLDIPIGMLTLRQLACELLCTLFAFLALAALARSVELDALWPWRAGFRRALAAILGTRRP